jgi:hypothetical protein
MRCRRRRRHQRARPTTGRRLAHQRAVSANAKGRDNERKVGEALAFLAKCGCLKDPFLSKPFDLLDSQGIDAGFTTIQGVKVVFNTKSSGAGLAKHRRKHPGIPCVNLQGYTHIRDIAVLIQRQFGLPELPTGDPDAADA